MSENDYAWLLKTIATTPGNINLLYNIKVKIPEIILLNNAEPKAWFYQEKDQIKMKHENYLKLRLVKEYFVDPETVKDPQAFDFDYVVYNGNKQSVPDNDANRILFCVNIEQPAKEIKVIKKITKGVADALFSQLQDSLEYCKTWTKVFSYFPNKNAGLFDVFLTKGLHEENPKIRILKRDFSLKDVELKDFSKDDGRRRNQELFPKNDKMMSSNNYSSVATSINTVIEKTVKALVRFLQGKTKLTLGEMHLELIVDASYTTWLLGSKGIYFYGDEGELDKEMDKETFDFPKNELKHFFTCPGPYCKLGKENNFYQDGDEAVTLYDKKNAKPETFEIPFKSIILDIIEKTKQVSNLESNLPEYSHKHVLHFVETHPFDFRKYYSIGEILESYLFKGYRVSNFYKTMRVCQSCHFVYEKIDGYRLQKTLKPENGKINVEEARLTFDKYFEKNAPSGDDKQKKRVFSKAFYERLKLFDKNILEILGLEKKVETVEDFFELTSSKLKNLSPLRKTTDAFIRNDFGTPTTVRFPVIKKEIIKDPDNIIKRERVKINEKTKAEIVGYKHYLGHASYLSDSGAGYALSKSSIKLNNLQDKLNRFNVVVNGLIGEASSTGENTQIDVNDFQGGIRGQYDTLRVETRQSQFKKGKDMSTPVSLRSSALFNVAVDKVDFISDKEKAAIYEKANRKKEKEMQEKNFLATHNLLAQSIHTISSVKKTEYSTKGQYDD